jgi:hypothetical protein
VKGRFNPFRDSVACAIDESACNPKPKKLRQGERNTFNAVHDDLANYVEFRCFGLFQKFPVFKSCEPSVPSGQIVVSGEVMAQLLVYTLTK